MNTLSTQVLAQVQAAVEAGDKNGAIIRDLKQDGHKVSAAQINQVRESMVVQLAPTDVVLDDSVELVVDDKSSKLAAMLAASQAAQAAAPEVKVTRASRSSVTVIKVATTPCKNVDGSNKQRRNHNLATRSVAVFTSESMKTCFIGTHIGFTTKTAEGAIKIFRTAPQQALKAMQKAEDIQLVIAAKDVQQGADLDAVKAATYDQYAALGYQMLCRRGSPVPAQAVVETPAPETVAITTEQVQELAEEFSETLA